MPQQRNNATLLAELQRLLEEQQQQPPSQRVIAQVDPTAQPQGGQVEQAAAGIDRSPSVFDDPMTRTMRDVMGAVREFGETPLVEANPTGEGPTHPLARLGSFVSQPVNLLSLAAMGTPAGAVGSAVRAADTAAMAPYLADAEGGDQAVTTFIGRGRVPDVAGRVAASGRAVASFVDFAKQYLPHWTPEQVEQVTNVLTRYPRVAAHAGRFQSLGSGVALGNRGLFSPTAGGRGAISLNPKSANPNTVVHELVHGAQNVGLKQHFMPDYEAADELFGYARNPYEVNARVGARRRAPMDAGDMAEALGDYTRGTSTYQHAPTAVTDESRRVMEEAFETAEKAASFRERPIILSKSDDAISDAEKRADDLLRFLGQEPAQFGRGQSTRAQVAAEGNRPSGVERLEALLEGMARGGRGRGVESRRIDPPLEGVGLPMANPSMQPASGSVAHRPRRLFHYNEEPWWNIADRPRGSGQGGAGFTRGIYGTQRLAGAKDFAQEAPGYLYEMRLMAEPEQILDWTSDITEQSPYAMERLMKILEQYNITEGNPKMGNVLLRLQRKEPELPSVMKREGLAAVEYPSRLTATPPGRRRRHGNAVVWDDDLLEVLRRFPLLRR